MNNEKQSRPKTLSESQKIPLWIRKMVKFFFVWLWLLVVFYFGLSVFIGFDRNEFTQNIRNDMLLTVEEFNQYVPPSMAFSFSTEFQKALGDRSQPIVTTLKTHRGKEEIVIRVYSDFYGERLKKEVELNGKLVGTYLYPRESAWKRFLRKVRLYTVF